MSYASIQAATTSSSSGIRSASIALPPQVRGPDRGVLCVTIDEIVYFASSRLASQRQPPLSLDHGTTIIRLRWWGEQGEGHIWKPVALSMDTDGLVKQSPITVNLNAAKPAAASASSSSSAITHTQEFQHSTQNTQAHTVNYPIVVSPNTFTNYLNDAQWLVFEVYHFLETDPAAIQRTLHKQLQRLSNPNRSIPHAASPLSHLMFDLAPLCDALSFGELEWSGHKNLPIVVNGVPIGQVSVRMSSKLKSGSGSIGTFSQFEEKENAQHLPSRTSALHPSYTPVTRSNLPIPSASLSRTDTFPASAIDPDPFNISLLISQAEDMSKTISQSLHGPPLDTAAFIQQYKLK